MFFISAEYIPSGLQIGDRIVWICDEDGKNSQPEPGSVKWIGKIRSTFYAGVQFVRH